MLVSESMIPVAEGISYDTTLPEAALIMRKRGTAVLPVLDDSCLVGVVTDWDIVTRGVVSGRNTDRLPVSEVMSVAIFTVPFDADAQDVARRLSQDRLRQLAVVDLRGDIIGVVSVADIAIGTGHDEHRAMTVESALSPS